MYKPLFPMNLQLFSDSEPEEIEIIEEHPEQDDDELDVQPGEEIEVDPDAEEVEPEVEAEPVVKEKSPQESALIKYKQEAKEANRKLKEVEERLALKEAAEAESKRTDELIEAGYPEADAKKFAMAELALKKLETENRELRYEKLEKSIPGISKHKEAIDELKSKYPEMTEKELYLAKFSDQSEYDKRTQIEQEMLHKAEQSRHKGTAETSTADKPNDKAVKLSPANERAFRLIQERRPGFTRKQYQELTEE